MNSRWTMRFELPGVHGKTTVISPYVSSRNAAAIWLYKLKPQAFARLETFEIRPYQRGDG